MLNIGGLNFSVEVGLQDLDKAINRLKEFSRSVDKAASSQEKGAQAAANAMGRQESAIKKALQTLINLQNRMKASGASAAEIDKTTKAFHRLVAEMTSGKLSTIEFNRSMDAFTARMGRARRTFSGSKGANEFARHIRDIESASVLAVGPLSGLGARISALGSIATRSQLKMAAMFAVAAGGVVSLYKLSGAAIQAAMQLERIQAGFLAVSGSTIYAQKEFNYASNVAVKYGVDLRVLARQYSLLSVATQNTTLAGEKTRKIFESLTMAAAALRQTNEQVEGSFRAVIQMISKGTIQAEELRGQLSERVVGAYGLVADALGVTTEKLGDMLKKGEVLAADVLPKFAEKLKEVYGEQALRNVTSLQGRINNLNNQWFLFAGTLDHTIGISKAAAVTLESLASIFEFLRSNLKEVMAVMGGVTGAFIGLSAPMIVNAFMWLVNAIKGITASLYAMAISANVASGSLAGIVGVALRIGAVIVGAVAGHEALSYAMKETKASGENLRSVIDSLSGSLENLSQVQLQARAYELEDIVRQMELSIVGTKKKIAEMSDDIDNAIAPKRVRGPSSHQSAIRKRFQEVQEATKRALRGQKIELGLDTEKLDIAKKSLADVQKLLSGDKSPLKKGIQTSTTQQTQMSRVIDRYATDWEKAADRIEEVETLFPQDADLWARAVNKEIETVERGWTRIGKVEDKASDKIEKRRKQFLSSYTTPVEKAIKRIQEAYELFGDNPEIMQRVYTQEADKLNKLEERAKQAATSIQGSFEYMAAQIEKSVDNWHKSFVDAIVDGKFQMGDFVNSILRDFARIAVSRATQPVFDELTGIFSAAAGQLFGVSPTTTSQPAANQYVLAHQGAIVGKSSSGSRTIPSIAFANAPRMHSGGLVSGEQPIIAKNGEGVFTPEQMKALAPANTGSPRVFVNIIENGGKAGDVSSQEMPDGSLQLDVFVNQIRASFLDDMYNAGPYHKAMENFYSLDRMSQQR